MAVLFKVLVIFQLYLTLCISTKIVHIDATRGKDVINCRASSCQSLQYAVNLSCNDVSFILQTDIYLEKSLHVSRCHNLTITGSSSLNQIICTRNCRSKSTGCGMVFESIENLNLIKLHVKYCNLRFKVQQNSHLNMLSLHSAVFVVNGTGLTVFNCFNASYNMGHGTTIFNTRTNVKIYKSHFSNNSLSNCAYIMNDVSHKTIHGGVGLVVIITDQHKAANSQSGWMYDISGVYFYSNHQSLGCYNSKLQQKSYSNGGGLAILLSNTSITNQFLIQNIRLLNNTGGGIAISCKNCQNNIFNIANVIYNQNFAQKNGGGGGGLILGLTSNSKNNTFMFKNNKFMSNSGKFGAGVLIYTGAGKISANNTIKFTNSLWLDNVGQISPAVDIAPDFDYEDQTNLLNNTIIFENCTFSCNQIGNMKNKRQQQSGIFLVTKQKVIFEGYTNFIHNNATALFLISSIAVFKQNAITTFRNNTGVQGGAVSLLAFSQLKYDDNTHFYFIGNKAFKGGAIFVTDIDQHILYASHTCFLLLNEPNATMVNFTFIDNKATADLTSNSMYLTSFKPCQLQALCGHTDTLVPMQIFNHTTCFGYFSYGNDGNITKPQLSTDGCNISIELPVNQDRLSIVPGRFTNLPITVFDEFQNNVTHTAIYTPKLEGCNATIGKGFTYTVQNHIKILGKSQTECTLTLTGHWHSGTVLSVPIVLSECPPGYVNYINECVCSSSADTKHQYFGITKCNTSSNTAIIIPGLWVGYISEHNMSQDNLYTAICPIGYCSDVIQLHAESNETLDKIMCFSNRSGFLCSTCMTNYSVFFNDIYYHCKDNKYCQFGILFYALLELMPISLLFIVIIISNISLTSGPAYSIAFLAQMTYTIRFVVDSSKPFPTFEYINRIYGVINLDFITYSFCIWESATTLFVIAIKYVSVAFAFGLVICCVLVVRNCNCGRLTRCLRCGNKQHSFVQGISAFLVICYSQCVTATFKILTYSNVSGIGISKQMKRVHFSGNMDYFGSEHLVYAIPAVIVSLCVVIPLPLILTFDPFLLKFEAYFCTHMRFLPWSHLRNKLKPFLDSFQCCFRKDAYYFAGLFFVYRIIINSICLVITDSKPFFLYLAIVLLLMLTVQATTQPFENKWHNILSSCVFALLLCTTIITIRIYTVYRENQIEVLVLYYLQTMLAFLPIFAGVIWFLGSMTWKFYHWKRSNQTNIEDRFSSLSWGNRPRLYDSISLNSTAE